MNYNEFIERNPAVLVGKPIIKGTRISVELILRKMSEGATIADLLKAYPHLTGQQIYAVLVYSAHLISKDSLLEAAGYRIAFNSKTTIFVLP